jgi:DNA-binding transcriptional MerR regulator
MTTNVALAATGKSPEAFRTIGEAAAELNVPQHVLRFWESRFSQIRPLKRAGGRRFYRPQDMELLRGIRTLLYHEGYTIKGAQKVLRERGVRHVAGIGRNDGDRDLFDSSTEISGDSSIDALGTLARVRAEAGGALDEDRRKRLEQILKELLELKARLRAH